VALQPDQRLLWVGNNAADSAAIRGHGDRHPQPENPQAPGDRGGHHEIAFSKDSRFAFVSNRDDGTLSVIDIASLTIVKQLKTGSHPLSVVYSALSGAAYVADGKDGTVRWSTPEPVSAPGDQGQAGPRPDALQRRRPFRHRAQYPGEPGGGHRRQPPTS
jgi:YVTN family beta-propeller protein